MRDGGEGLHIVTSVRRRTLVVEHLVVHDGEVDGLRQILSLAAVIGEHANPPVQFGALGGVQVFAVGWRIEVIDPLANIRDVLVLNRDSDERCSSRGTKRVARQKCTDFVFGAFALHLHQRVEVFEGGYFFNAVYTGFAKEAKCRLVEPIGGEKGSETDGTKGASRW